MIKVENIEVWGFEHAIRGMRNPLNSWDRSDSYNQRRTVTMTYENVMNMLDYREGHKLDEWREFCEILRALPHVEVIRNGK